MESDLNKYCLIDGSPTTVLPPPRSHSKPSNRRKLRYVSEIPSVGEDVEINYSASYIDFQSKRATLEGDAVVRRGSIYHSSREVCLLHPTDAALERKTTELSRATNSSPSIEIVDSDEDSCLSEKSKSLRYGNEEEKDPTVNLPEPPAKSRFSPVKKMWEPFVKYKSQKEDRVHQVSVSQCSPAHLHGIFKRGAKNGAPFFHFSVMSLDDAYVAKTRKAGNNSNLVYTFHSIPHSHRHRHNVSGWGFKESIRESSTNCEMHVSSCHYTEFKRVGESKDFMVTEFVLYDVTKASKLHPGLEIAAVVMQAPMEKRESLKFKSVDRTIGGAPPNLLDLFQLGKDTSDSWSRGKIHVVIPAGNHGLPIAECEGPSSLLHRWRLGGGCDCGGWDMACPLTIFSNPTFLINDPNPTQLFVQGRKDDTLGFTMRMIEDGKYAVDFHAQLSSLQAFSICIAMLHVADVSDFGPERSKETQHSDSLLLFTAKEEKSKGSMPSFVQNPPFSPIARA